MYSSIYINVRMLYTTFEVCTIQRQLDDTVMTVRQRVSSVLEDESFIVERIETQFGHSNSVEDVVGGLERVKFCHGVHFLALQNCQKVSVVNILFYNVFLYTLGFFLRLFTTVQGVHFRPQPDKLSGHERTCFRLELPQDLVVCHGIERMVFFEIAGVVFVRVHLHVLVQICSLNVTTERVCVGEE